MPHRRAAASAVLLLLLCSSGAHAHAEVYEDPELEPEVEPSSLERHRTATHDDTGVQFNFVKTEVDEDGDSEPAGARRGEGGVLNAASIKDLLELMSQAQASRQTAAPQLPQVAKDVPISEVLQGIRRSLHQLHRPEQTKAGRSDIETDAYIAHLRCDTCHTTPTHGTPDRLA